MRLDEVMRWIAPIVAANSMLLASTVVGAEAPATPLPRVVVIASKILDVRTGHYLNDAAIYIAGERVQAVGPAQTVLASAKADSPAVIDLHGATVLPGLIDCHTHLMARIPE